MKLMRADMGTRWSSPGFHSFPLTSRIGGAATVVASALAIAQLQLPINLIVATPLTENLPGPSATKPGDVYVLKGLGKRSGLTVSQHIRHEWQVGRG